MAQITLGQILHTQGVEPLSTTDGALNVALSGSIVETVAVRTVEQVFARAVRSEHSAYVTKQAPPGARGAAVTLVVWGITGANPEVYIEVGTKPHDGPDSRMAIIQSPKLTGANNVMVIGYPGVSATSEDFVALRTFATSLPLIPLVETGIRISGSFGAGQGIDCEVYIEWMF